MGHAEIQWNKAHLQKLRSKTIHQIKKMKETSSINCTELAQLPFGMDKSPSYSNLDNNDVGDNNNAHHLTWPTAMNQNYNYHY
mmetsp:Transcript_44399/g.93234  ORF Transcript_44399/g.93234 Transcript_44399/m.93234 type:complete len:83 (-) Transcript_44399:81-329(-)